LFEHPRPESSHPPLCTALNGRARSFIRRNWVPALQGLCVRRRDLATDAVALQFGKAGSGVVAGIGDPGLPSCRGVCVRRRAASEAVRRGGRPTIWEWTRLPGAASGAVSTTLKALSPTEGRLPYKFLILNLYFPYGAPGCFSKSGRYAS
jgi:hypothetical protein